MTSGLNATARDHFSDSTTGPYHFELLSASILLSQLLSVPEPHNSVVDLWKPNKPAQELSQ